MSNMRYETGTPNVIWLRIKNHWHNIATALGLGSAAYEDIGTSGDAVPKLNAANTWSANQEFGAFDWVGASKGVLIDAANGRISSSYNKTTSHNHEVFRNTNGVVGRIVSSGSSTAYVTSSDARKKDWIETTLEPGSVIEEIAGLLGRFTWKASGAADYGATAQSLNRVFPKAVNYDEENDDWGVDWSTTVPNLIAYVVAENQALKARVAALEAR